MKKMNSFMIRRSLLSHAVAVGSILIFSSSASSAEQASSNQLPPVVKDGKIGFVMTHRQWGVIHTAGAKQECPQGMNQGPREQGKVLFPDDGKKRTYLETHLAREGEQWLHTMGTDPIPFIEATGGVSYGMNLDGKVKDTDFTSPDGEKGIDNQMFRASGCISDFRGPSVQAIWWYENEYVRRYVANRFMIEISDVNSLENDDDVTVKSYRGMDDLLIDAIGDATGQVITPGGSQRIDQRWGKFAQSTWKGKIVNGTLITEPSDVVLPVMSRFSTSAILPVKGMRFQLKLSSQRAEGVMAGYTDIEGFQLYINSSWPQSYHAIGEMPTVSFFNAIDRLADGYPDPQTGKMTAISSAMTVRFTQVYILPSDQKPRPLASSDKAPVSVPSR